jgi:ribosomal protein L27
MIMMMTLGTLSSPTNAFVIIPAMATTTTPNTATTTGNRHRLPSILQLATASSSSSSIDFQSDSTQFGRGDYHLSASLQEGDVVVYQTGTWLVDGVEVGSGTPPTLQYAKIEAIQLVWTHNCEHGVLRGIEVNIDTDIDIDIADPSRIITPTEPLVEVEFGPEQLVARIPVKWNEQKDEGVSEVWFEDSMFVVCAGMDE